MKVVCRPGCGVIYDSDGQRDRCPNCDGDMFSEVVEVCVVCSNRPEDPMSAVDYPCHNFGHDFQWVVRRSKDCPNGCSSDSAGGGTYCRICEGAGWVVTT
jgi:hypothetical protein